MTIIKYELTDGTIVEFKASEDIRKIVIEFDADDSNQRRYARRRKEKSIDAMLFYGIEVIDPRQDVEKIIDGKQASEALLNAVSLLSLKKQILIKMVYYEGFTLSEIAARQGVHKSTIHRQLNAIHNELRELLNQNH